MKFRISSALKDIIGKELITNDLVAIFELVKNSYDAGANEVKITFVNVKKGINTKSRIIISDNGSGMSPNDIEEKWLFVGYSEKKFSEKELKNFRTKIQKSRIFAGAKGIGRFSCDRLGSQLKIYTKSKEDKDFSVLDVNWETFEKDQNQEFQTIDVNVSRSKTSPNFLGKNTGTVLEISKLNEDWDRKKLQNLKKYLQRLINPNQVSDDDAFSIKLDAKEFLSEDKTKKFAIEKINGEISNIVYEKLAMKTTMLDVHVSDNGKKIKTRLEDKGNFIFEYVELNEFLELKNICVKVSYLNTQAKSTFTRLMGIEPTQYGNIFLFKNGFRILPYGEEGDDWLGLDKRKGQGYARFLGTRELLGRVEITGYQPELREVSSRSEGLVKTKSYSQLTEFILKKVIRVLERYVVEAIDWDSERDSDKDKREGKIKKSDELKKLDTLNLIREIAGGKLDSNKINYNKKFLELYKEKEIEKIPEIIKNIEHKITQEKKKGRKEFLTKELKKLKQSINLKEKKVKQDVKILEDEKKSLKKEKTIIETENIFLKSTSSNDKERVISLFHHIGIHSDTIKSHAGSLLTSLNAFENLPENVYKQIESISQLSQIVNTISKIGFKGGITQEMEHEEQDLVIFIQEFIKNICIPYYGSVKITIHNFVSKKLIKNFRPFEMTYVIDNLISNSKKASATEIEFKLSEEDESVILDVIDNGKGLSPKINDISSIFERNVTTTRGGAGLGLYDAKKILSKIKAKISAEDLDKGFRIKIVISK